MYLLAPGFDSVPGKFELAVQLSRITLPYLLFISLVSLQSGILNALGHFGAAASAIGNVGPAFGVFGPTDNYALLNPIGKWMLTFCMLLGRLEIFTIMVLFTRSFRK